MRTAAAYLFLPCLLSALPASAGFGQPEQAVRLAYGQKVATLVFSTSDGSTVTRAKPLCDCTTVRLEGARLVAEVDTSTFDISTEKQIVARTSDGRQTTLTMRFEVPQAVIISAPSLEWQRGAAPEPQEFRIRIPEGSPVRKLSSAGLVGDAFVYHAATITPGREFAVTVIPKSTAHRALNRLVIKMDADAPQHRQRILYLRIR